MRTFRSNARWTCGLGLLLTLLLMGAVAPAGAMLACPADADACLFVNTNADADSRDGVLSLREAALLVSGELGVGELTAGEQAQVVVTTELGLGGCGLDAIYFDPTIFQANAPTRVIELGSSIVLAAPPLIGQGPGPGDPHGVRGGVLELAGSSSEGLDSPPLIGQCPGPGAPQWARGGAAKLAWMGLEVPDSPPVIGRGPGPGVVLGMAWDAVAEGEIPAPVVLDGSALTAPAACLTVARPGSWIRGLTLADCPTAIELVGEAVGTTLIGTNGDNVNDEAEAVVVQ